MAPQTIGIATGAPQGVYREIATALEQVAREAGCDVRPVADAESARTADVVLALGYPGYYPFLAAPTPGVRVAWLGEPLAPPVESTVTRIRRQMPMGRVLDPAIAIATTGGRRPIPRKLGTWRERASFEHVQRVNMAAHRRAARAGIRLIVTSQDHAATLHRSGVDAEVVPFGFHAAWAGPPHDVDDSARDIDVLIFGTGMTGTGIRRAHYVEAVIAELGPGVRTYIARTGVWGLERQRLLGRARVAFTINQVPGNFLGIRTVMQAAAGAVSVSDPIRSPAPFIPGVHYVEAPVDELAVTIATLLADRPRRLRIAAEAQRLVVEEMTLARSFSAILATLR